MRTKSSDYLDLATYEFYCSKWFLGFYTEGSHRAPKTDERGALKN
jgi:hypothetical protein